MFFFFEYDVAQEGSLRNQQLSDRTIQEMTQSHQVKPMHLVLAWAIRSNKLIAIPKAAREEHALQNAVAASNELTQEDLDKLHKASPLLPIKIPLDIV